MVKAQQTERMGIRLTPGEAKMLEALSEATGLTMSNVVRQAIRREYAERFGQAEPKPKPKPKR
jgi:predicted DNA-binding protein